MNVSDIPRWTSSLNATPTQDSEPAPKSMSVRDSITACAFLLGYTALYLSVGFAAVFLVERAWLAVLE
jgi:hypothetical protein